MAKSTGGTIVTLRKNGQCMFETSFGNRKWRCFLSSAISSPSSFTLSLLLFTLRLYTCRVRDLWRLRKTVFFKGFILSLVLYSEVRKGGGGGFSIERERRGSENSPPPPLHPKRDRKFLIEKIRRFLRWIFIMKWFWKHGYILPVLRFFPNVTFSNHNIACIFSFIIVRYF